MIHEAYVSFETAKLLKEKGFDWDCNAIYGRRGEFQRNTDKAFNNGGLHVTSAPTCQMACAWLRQKGFEIGVFYLFKAINPDVTVFDGYIPNVTQIINGVYKDSWDLNTVKDYNEAIEAALKYTLENLIEEQQ